MALLPVRPDRLKDPAFLEEFRGRIFLEVMDELTHPSASYDAECEAFTRFSREEKFPKGDRTIRARFVRCCQEVRLTPDEIDELQSLWFS